jgi:hypothetical protein
MYQVTIHVREQRTEYDARMYIWNVDSTGKRVLLADDACVLPKFSGDEEDLQAAFLRLRHFSEILMAGKDGVSPLESLF